jgi:hypothetical protein
LSDCNFCPGGYEFVSSVESTACTICTSGKYQQSDTTESVQCKMCPAGKYNPRKSSTGDGTLFDGLDDCSDCEGGISKEDRQSCGPEPKYEVSVIRPSVNPKEGQHFKFQLELTSDIAPGKEVQVKVVSTSSSTCTVPQDTVTFTSKNASTIQITIVDNNIDEGDTPAQCELTHEIFSSDDSNYHATSSSPTSFEFSITNDDIAGISLAIKQGVTLYESKMLSFIANDMPAISSFVIENSNYVGDELETL